MAGLSVSGIASGIDTQSLVSQLMLAEAAPRTALKSKVTATQGVISAYQFVNTRVASLQTAAEKLDAPEDWRSPTGSSSSTSVTVSTAGTATPGSLTFDVTAVAAAHSLATPAEAAADPSSAGRSFTITQKERDASGALVDKAPVTLTSANGDLSSVATAINDAKLGLNAVAVQVSPGQYRLQVTSAETGTQSAFTLDGLGATTTVRQAADAVVDLGGGMTVTSATNTFKDVLAGTSFTVSKPETGVTVQATVDPKAMADKVAAMVDFANSTLTEIGTQTAWNATTKKGAALSADSTVKALGRSITSRATLPVAEHGSPSQAGIQSETTGRLKFDRDAFLELYASDPAKAEALVTGVAQQMVALAKEATDKTTGTITNAINGRNNDVTDLNRRIEAWDVRLAAREKNLNRQFTAMESALSSLQNQSNWLAGQLASLPRYA